MVSGLIERPHTVLMSLPVPWDYPNLSNKSTTTSPFTLVFKEIGSSKLMPLCLSMLSSNYDSQTQRPRL